MKKFSLFLFQIICIFIFSNFVFAGGFEKTGEYYRYYNDDGSVLYDEIVEYDRDKYYCNDNGYVVFNSWINKDAKYYYAGNDAKFYRDGKYKIDGYYYYFDFEGALMKGWIQDMYYGSEDGFLVNGFQELDVPKGWATESTKDKTAWFYFDSNTCKKVYSENEPYIAKTIGSSKYCFDQNGIIRTGWRQIKETIPVMKGYMYFSEETTDDFEYGEAIINTWYSIEPPADVLPSSEVRYFYFNGQGVPRTAPVGKLIKVRLDDKTYCFNEYGYAIYGLHKIDNEYYYFGNSVEDCSMKIGLFNKDIDDSGTGKLYYFEDNGVGFTGIHNNKLFYKGKLQSAGTEQKYAAFKVENLLRLVNTSGTLMKNKNKIKDGDGTLWSTNSGGVVTYTDEGVATDLDVPNETGEN